jgi:hypothetical protein
MDSYSVLVGDLCVAFFSWTGRSETLSSVIPCEVDALEEFVMNVFQVSGCETLLRCYPPGMLRFSICLHARRVRHGEACLFYESSCSFRGTVRYIR